MLKMNQLSNVSIVIGFCLFLWSSVVAGLPDPELRTKEFFSFELDAGDRLVHDGPHQNLVIEGPATVAWRWDDDALYMKSSMGEAKVRPLEAFPHEDMTEEMIIRARARYVSVPFIDEYLRASPNPTNREWAKAYKAWLDASGCLSQDLRTKFKNDQRDISLVAEKLAEQADGNKLIVPGSVRIEHTHGSNQVDLWMVIKGMPTHPDGTPDEVLLILNRDWIEPSPRPTRISRKDALAFHHGVNTLFVSSKGPLVVKLGKGISISTSEGR